MIKPFKVTRTFVVGLESHPALITAVTAVSTAVAEMLERMHRHMEVVVDSATDSLEAVDLLLPVSGKRLERARKAVEKPRKVAREEAGPRELAQPRYKNSYHMEEIYDRGGRECVRCRVAEAYSWEAKDGKIQRAVYKLDARIGFQGLLKTYLPIDWREVPSDLRAGVCQQAAQGFNSFVGLLADGSEPSYPAALSRDPKVRLRECWKALDKWALSTRPLETVRARDLMPDKYEADDPRGDRPVTIDEDWVNFTKSPFPRRYPLLFMKSDQVVLYRGSWPKPGSPKRLLATVPILNGLREESSLSRVLANSNPLRWQSHAASFSPLGLWAKQRKRSKGKVVFADRELGPRTRTMLLPIETRSVERIERFLGGDNCRKPAVARITERPKSSGRNRGNRKWELEIATNREVKPKIRPNVLGVHFGIDPIIWWSLLDSSGESLETGSIQGNEVLDEGLRRQLKLHSEQGEQRWVGDRTFAGRLKTRTDEIATQIVALAVRNNANLAIESIGWVDKQHGGADLNRRHSMWNFSQLEKRIAWKGWENCTKDKDDPVVTISNVSDFLLRFTCPHCGACRRAKQKEGKEDTYFSAGELHCRKCNKTGSLSPEDQADLVATNGLKRFQKLLKELQFLLRFTCPHCGACRRAKQKEGKEDTYFSAGELHCRKCNKTGSLSPEDQADLVESFGFKGLETLRE